MILQNIDPESLFWTSLDIDPEAVDTYDRIQQIQSREAQQSGERKLRHWYAIAIIALLTLQLLFIGAIVFLLGFGIITLDRWVATTLIAATLTEISGLAYLVIRYLFPLDPSPTPAA